MLSLSGGGRSPLGISRICKSANAQLDALFVGAGVGIVGIIGSGAGALAGFTCAGAGRVGIIGEGAAGLGTFTASGSGTVTPPG